MICVELLKRKLGPDQKVYLIGSQGLRDAFDEANIQHFGEGVSNFICVQHFLSDSWKFEINFTEFTPAMVPKISYEFKQNSVKSGCGSTFSEWLDESYSIILFTYSGSPILVALFVFEVMCHYIRIWLYLGIFRPTWKCTKVRTGFCLIFNAYHFRMLRKFLVNSENVLCLCTETDFSRTMLPTTRTGTFCTEKCPWTQR